MGTGTTVSWRSLDLKFGTETKETPNRPSDKTNQKSREVERTREGGR